MRDIYEPSVRNRPGNINPLNATENGRKLLAGEDELLSYIAAYGAHHFYKLNDAFKDATLETLHNQNVEVFDWGCGQAIATCILIDYLLTHQVYPIINRITLIEPSVDAIQKGQFYLEGMLSGNIDIASNVRQVCSRLDDVLETSVQSHPENVKIHLFSNILDVESVDIDRLYGLITKTNQGVNKFICVGPYNSERIKIDKFYQLFNQNHWAEQTTHKTQPLTGRWWKLGESSSPPFSERPVMRYERQFTVSLEGIKP